MPVPQEVLPLDGPVMHKVFAGWRGFARAAID
jgi:hypothetical protein